MDNSAPLPVDESAEPTAPLDALHAELLDVDGAPAATEPAAPAAPVVPTDQVLAGLLVPVFSALAPAWALQDDECAALAAGWAPVVDKYLPADQIEKWGPWVGALGVTAAVLGPRIGKPRKHNQPETALGAQDNKRTDAPADDGTVNYAAPPEPATPRL